MSESEIDDDSTNSVNSSDEDRSDDGRSVSDFDDDNSSSDNNSTTSDSESVTSKSTHVSDRSGRSGSKSKIHTSKNIFKIYKQTRERHLETLLNNDKYEELESLGIDLSNYGSKTDAEKDFENIATNAYANYCCQHESCINNIWDHPTFNNIRDQFNHECDIITNPPQVLEGVVECPRCKSKKTITYEQQVRSADEGTTTFIKCMNPKCGKVSRSYA